MIRKSVVLVLGAGASKPYGYPVGSDLVALILKSNFQQVFPIYLKRFGDEVDRVAEAEQIVSFQTALRHSMRTSIDSFLETNHQYQELGKAVIALLLTQYENEQHLYPEDRREDWYRYFFELVFRDCTARQFPDNNFSIITYNYDRSFEFAFFRALRQLYPTLPETDIYQLFSRIPILHPHGMIGLPKLFSSQKGRLYAPISNFEEMIESVENIRIVSEDVEKDPIFRRIYVLLEGAEYIVFLGFGYNELNLRRLRLSEVANKEAEMYGTCLGFTKSEQTQFIIKPLSGYKDIQLFDGNVLAFLRTHLEVFLR
jgi:hypothetical protein